jgi:hypothetical protein
VGRIDVDRVQLAGGVLVAARADADEAHELPVDLGDERGREPAVLIEPRLERRPGEGVRGSPGADVEACAGVGVVLRSRADQHAPEPTLEP